MTPLAPRPRGGVPRRQGRERGTEAPRPRGPGVSGGSLKHLPSHPRSDLGLAVHVLKPLSLGLSVQRVLCSAMEPSMVSDETLPALRTPDQVAVQEVDAGPRASCSRAGPGAHGAIPGPLSRPELP